MPTSRPDRRRSRTARALSGIGLGGGAALLAAGAGASWYYASRLVEAPADTIPGEPPPEDRAVVEAFEIGGDRHGVVALSGEGAATPGTWGLVLETAYLRLGPDVEVDEDGHVRRSIQVVAGHPEVGAEGVLDAYAYPPDPTLLTARVENITFTSPIGTLPAWWFAPKADHGRGDVCVVAVHGRAAHRHEAFRLLGSALQTGVRAMVIAYRDDHEGPRSPDGLGHLGATEWEDVEGAVLEARARGARRIVLVGFSMGGAIVSRFLRMSAQRDHVAAVILEAPVLDWDPVVRAAAIDRGVPAALVPMLLPVSMAVASRRARINFRDLRTVDVEDAPRLPTLLIHGDADPVVPVEVSDAWAASRPDDVTYVRVPDALHVRAWNTDRPGYEAAIRDFLEAHVPPSEPQRRRGLRVGRRGR